jgi:hypothetical protein
MSNRTDFFQSAQARLALPAATVSVLLEGVLCPDLEVVEIVHGTWPEFGWARLAYNPAGRADADTLAAEEVETVPMYIGMGKSIYIRQVYNGIPPGAAAFGVPVFDGQIESIETELGPDGENVEIIARDFSANLRRATVYGQRVAESAGSSVFLAGLDTVFNADGQANASSAPIEVNGKSYTAFCAQPSRGKLWSYAEVIDYLLCEYLVDGQLHRPGLEQLRALTESQTVRDLDVTGLNLLEAVHRCCDRVGLRFKFVPRLAETRPSQALVFYKNGEGRAVEINCQKHGEQLSISKTNIARLSSIKNFWPITHKYIGQGDFKVYEASFELVKAWDPAGEDTDYEKFSPSTNPEFYKVRDIYRKWCLNEAGDYSGSPYNQGDAFDFSKIFQGCNYVRRRRRFWPALTTDKQGKSLGYYLEVSYDGVNWWQYLQAFNNLLDECGVWLSSDQLDVDTWVAALKKVLRFRITASVISDERLSCVVTDGPVDSCTAVVKQVITLPRQFKYRKVSDQSIFVNASDDALGEPDEADDSMALYEFVRHRAAVSAATIENIDIQTPILMFDYRVGDRVTSSPESRDLLGCRSDNRSKAWIERVQMDFQKQCTNLKIVRQRCV